MTWEKYATALREGVSESSAIESQVLSKLGGRLREFYLDEVGGQLILRGMASSYHVKQLAQHEVMGLTARPIRSNQIRVST